VSITGVLSAGVHKFAALFIMDQKGIITFAQYADNMADIPENGKLFQILEGLK